MKRLTAFVLALLMLSGLAGCGKNADYTVNVSGARVPDGVYAYYLDKVMSYPGQYGVKDEAPENLNAAALLLCKKYTALQSLMAENSITLAHYLKSKAAQDTEKTWSLFGAYYEKIGVSKQDISKIMTYEAGREQLVEYYFGEGGKKPVSEDDLKQRFVELYVGFRGFECRLTKENAKGETIPMTEKEKQQTEKELRSLADKVDSGTDINSVYSGYCKKHGLVATGELEVMLAKENDPMYDDDFFKKVSTISHGRAAIVKTGSSIYVVQREKIASSNDDVFTLYRTDVLNRMKMPEIEKTLAALAGKYTVTTDEKKLQKLYEAVSAQHAAS